MFNFHVAYMDRSLIFDMWAFLWIKITLELSLISSDGQEDQWALLGELGPSWPFLRSLKAWAAYGECPSNSNHKARRAHFLYLLYAVTSHCCAASTGLPLSCRHSWTTPRKVSFMLAATVSHWPSYQHEPGGHLKESISTSSGLHSFFFFSDLALFLLRFNAPNPSIYLL